MPRLLQKKIRGTKSGVWALPPRATVVANPPSAPGPPLCERRLLVRHFCEIGALVDSWPANIENISRGGLKVVIGRRFEVGTILKVEVALSDEDHFSMHLAKVVRIEQEPNGSWSLGCAFDQEISEDELQEFLNREDAK
jgi:hypothetical protein